MGPALHLATEEEWLEGSPTEDGWPLEVYCTARCRRVLGWATEWLPCVVV